MSNMHTLALLFTAAASLTACGGGGGDTPPPAPPAATDAIPDTASASSVGLKDYLVSLSKDLPEGKEAIDVAGFVPPTADDAEPEPID